MERIDVALTSDNCYFCGLFVAVCSMAKYAARDVDLRVHVLDGGITQENWRFLRQAAESQHPHIQLDSLVVDESHLAKYPVWKGNRMTYARLLLPELLSDADWCIYCDVDFTWCGDVAELWKERDDHYALLSNLDAGGSVVSAEERWFKAKGIPLDPAAYFCAGLCFFNLRMFRENQLIDKVFAFLGNHPDVQFADQSALNSVCLGKSKIISSRWQQFSMQLTADDFAAGVAIHHGGDVPWTLMGRRQPFTDARLAWFCLNAEFRQITVLQSILMFLPLWHALSHRAITWMFRCSLTRLPLRFLLVSVLRHRQVYDAYVKQSARKLPKDFGRIRYA